MPLLSKIQSNWKTGVYSIHAHIADLDAAEQMGDDLRLQVRKEWMLEGEHLQAWQAAWLGE